VLEVEKRLSNVFVGLGIRLFQFLTYIDNKIETHLCAGLPVQVRDYAMGLKDDTPKSGANKDFYIQNIEREVGT